MVQWLSYPDPFQKMRWPIRENTKRTYGIKSDAFHPFIKVRLRREQDLTKKPMATAGEALQVLPKWNVWSSRKLSLASDGDCHLEQQLLQEISRKVAKTVPCPHGGSSFLAILQPSYFSDPQENWGWKGKGSVLSCFINRRSVCVSFIHFQVP